jgi:hypothetical protein
MEYPEDIVVKDLNSYIKSLSTEIISIIWPDVKFSGFGQNHPIHWGNDTFAHEEDDEALDSFCKFRILFGLAPQWPVPLQNLIYYIFVHCPSIKI